MMMRLKPVSVNVVKLCRQNTLHIQHTLAADEKLSCHQVKLKFDIRDLAPDRGILCHENQMHTGTSSS